MDASGSDRPAKRKRLNFACNHCRAKKVRCDQLEPSCQGCLAAGVECVTIDKRRPGLEVRRRPAGSQDPTGSPRPRSLHRRVELLPALAPARSGTAEPAAVPPPGVVPITPASEPATATTTTTTTNRSPSMAPPPDNPGGSTAAGDPPSGEEPGRRRFAGRLPMMAPGARVSDGDTVEIMTGWLELAFHRLGIPSRFDACLRRKASPAAAPAPGIVPVALPAIPPAAQCREALAAYYATVHVLFPIVEPAVLDGICEDVVRSCAAGMIHAGRLPELLLFCLALVLGTAGGKPAAESSLSSSSLTTTNLATAYVGFCESMLGHVLGWGTVDSVRIVFLLALVLRWREKITAAWPLAGVCVSIAQVLGLDRRKPHGRRSSPEAVVSTDAERADQERRRVWWCVYSFEKLFAFELGRPSAIADADHHDHDQLEPARVPRPAPLRGGGRDNHDGSSEEDIDFFHIVISLARTLSEVSRRSIAARAKEERAGREGLESAIRFKVATTGECVLLLMRWAEGLPKHLRPTSDLLCEPAEFPAAAFVCVQYHSALIMLLRNTLLIHDEALRGAVEEHAAGQPWSQVTRNGQAIAASSARSIVRLLMDGHDRGSRPALPTVTAPLHVLSVLSVHLIRHPTSRVASSDISLIRTAGDFAVEKCELIAQDQRVRGIVQLLDSEVLRIVAAAQPPAARRASSITDGRLSSHSSLDNNNSPAGGGRSASRCESYNDSSGVVLNQSASSQGFSADGGGGLSSTGLMELSAEMPMSMAIPDVAWSPSLADEIGWDWGDFSQLFSEPVM
ncbi:uncharacterized protein THITE_115282 [Thermothielavioides terrestris NRRL 8126]|uniref:Zn(2)-C6 fungal-type domain-containing protein n=1 Tax=Thermothielavioides terrestris (strain ATCC 38088 / NRRL 8126) TaxID=578455 RepID=G2RDI6_THETT|nr:uncharacterized protein THITE_115282 [Thermothielavioides terrestris NRRL 8126]AEO69968.1 hypothetical protein THITE_115282 [Thermothielavioides terrestris NRRL 8126]